MKNVLAIARLTFWEGVRMRVVLIFLVILVFLVLRLPFTVKGDETVAGQLQTFLSYSLGAVSALLGLATVFLSCATLTSEIRNNSIHMVVTKPVSRFQILLGKWLGINALMLILLLLSAVAIYGFARIIRDRPVAFERDEIKIRDAVWRARVAAKPKPPYDFEAEAREWVASQQKQGQEYADVGQAIAQRINELENQWRTLPPGHAEAYVFDGLIPPRREDATIEVRYRARGIPMPLHEMLDINFAFAEPETLKVMGAWHHTRERARDLHRFFAHQAVIRDGQAAIIAANPLPPGARINIHFERDDWLEIMYNVGTFEENYVKTIVVIAARLTVLSAVGLFFSVFVSFPVACFCVLTFYLLCMGMPFWLESVGANMEYRVESIDPYGKFGPLVRTLIVPIMTLLFPNFQAYDGTKYLVGGEYIPLMLVAKSVAHTFLYGLGLLFLPGWLIFRSREIAEVTV